MDIVTQAVLGAVVGQAGFSHKLGRRALGWGAIIGILPDLDVIVKLSSNPFAEILYHRGITHSLWFGPVLGPVLGYLLWRLYGQKNALSAWVGLSVWALLTHPLLDLFTVYGTQLLAPLSNHRFTLSAVPIIDPVYTGILCLALVFGIFGYRFLRTSITIAYVALTLTSGYLFYGLAQNETAYGYARDQLAEEGHPYADVRVYTTMYQIFLRRIVVHLPDEIRVGFITTWAPQKIIWHKHPRAPEKTTKAILSHPYGKIYHWFTSDELIFLPHQGKVPSQWDMLDARFGFLGSSLWGIWGRTVTLDDQGQVSNDFQNFRIPLDIQALNIRTYWEAAFLSQNDKRKP